MSLPVFHLADAATVVPDQTVELTGAEGHHAAAVRRLRPQERLLLTDGRGAAARVEVLDVGRDRLACRVLDVRREPQPGPRLTVIQALPKGDRGERSVELMTEVGVDVIVPWQSERSVSRWTGERLLKGRAKWESVAREAAKQSRRLWWPEIAEPADTERAATILGDADRAWVLDEGAPATLAVDLEESELTGAGSVALVVGPEGGLTADELAVFGAAGARCVRLGPTVLRTSTAGLVAATLVLARGAGWRA